MKKLLMLLVSMCFVFSANAQWGEEEMSEKPSIKDRMFFGGGLGLSFSSYSDYFSISPIVGYKITPKLAGGLMFQYRYTKYKTVTAFNPNKRLWNFSIPSVQYFWAYFLARGI